MEGCLERRVLGTPGKCRRWWPRGLLGGRQGRTPQPSGLRQLSRPGREGLTGRSVPGGCARAVGTRYQPDRAQGDDAVAAPAGAQRAQRCAAENAP